MDRVGATIQAVALAARNPQLRRAEACWCVTIAAEWAHFVALGVYAYRSGGTAAVGLAGLLRLLPAAFVAPTAAGLANRYRPERSLAAVMLLGAVGLAGSAAAALAGMHLLVYLLAAVVGISTTLMRPTIQALLPALARTPQELVAANASTSSVEGLSALAAPLAAGAVIAVAPVWVVFAGGAAVVALGSLSLLGLHVVRDLGDTRKADGEPMPRHVLRAGAFVIALTTLQTFVRGCLNVLIVAGSFRLLHAGASGVGYLTAAIGAGGVLGAIGATAVGGRRLGRTFGVALVLWGLPIALIAPWRELAAAITLLAIVGAANSVEDVAAVTLLQRSVPARSLNRMLGIFWGAAMGGTAVGSVVAPPIVRLLGVRTAFAAVGLVLPLVVVAVYRRLIRLDAGSARERELELVEGVPMFAPLSLALKEQLAQRLEPVEVDAGDVVIRAGDAGDRFYVVAAGALDVTAARDRRSALGPGDSFGEIALLHDLARTATVTARTAASLYALGRDAFLSALTGRPEAEQAAHAIADRRLGADVVG